MGLSEPLSTISVPTFAHGMSSESYLKKINAYDVKSIDKRRIYAVCNQMMAMTIFFERFVMQALVFVILALYFNCYII